MAEHKQVIQHAFYCSAHAVPQDSRGADSVSTEPGGRMCSTDSTLSYCS